MKTKDKDNILEALDIEKEKLIPIIKGIVGDIVSNRHEYISDIVKEICALDLSEMEKVVAGFLVMKYILIVR